MKNQKKYSKKASFGKNEIDESRIFLRRNNTFAMVNIKPKLPGHVLVCNQRNVPKLEDLTEMETVDL